MTVKNEKENERLKSYIRNNYKFSNVSFNINDSEDMKLWEWLEKVAPAKRNKGEWLKISKVSYIKRLIKEDMIKNQK